MPKRQIAVTWSHAATQLEARFDPIQLPNEGARTDTSHEVLSLGEAGGIDPRAPLRSAAR
jgi:hypothetical protein